MSDADAIRVRPQDIKAGVTRITNASLVNGLIKKQAQALELLGKVSPITIDDITIDGSGAVLIEDATFSDRVREMDGLVEVKNGACGAGC